MARATSLVESQLDSADAAAFEAVIQRDKLRNAEAERALVSSRDALEHELASEPFDQARARIAVTNINEAFSRFIDSFSATVIDALSQLSPKGRKKLIELRHERLGSLDPPPPP